MTTKQWTVHPATSPLRGVIEVPGDKSIGHRALIFAAIADGTSTLTGLSQGEDNRATRNALEAMGVPIEELSPTSLRVHGVGLDGLSAPSAPLDCGNSGTTMRLLAGLLVGQRFDSVLCGDTSLSSRPMARVCKPLRARGGRIDGVFDAARNDEVAPLTIRARTQDLGLSELEYASPVASAQLKSAVLLSGLYASGSTLVTEPMMSRDHTERMLHAMGVPLQTLGPSVFLDPQGEDWDGRLRAIDQDIPSDPSSALFAIAAAAVVEGSRIAVRRVCINPTRTGALEVLRDMGFSVFHSPKGDSGGEPVADLVVNSKSGRLRSGARVGGELAVRAIDEIPALVAIASTVPFRSEFRDVRELRVKESDRIAAMVAVLKAFGCDVEEHPDGLSFTGQSLVGAHIDSRGDHRVAMSAVVMALVAKGPTVINDVGCVDTSFPGFAETLRQLGVSIEESVR
ncbi:MAG: 3-phosphoshikimate 1-carboxyvinyltransferase [Deltaproteobacteria bacterium]|nr:3-phosphoshikimate 1-carboxyvinyltransferase [Deltaproteobacteria bacterium]